MGRETADNITMRTAIDRQCLETSLIDKKIKSREVKQVGENMGVLMGVNVVIGLFSLGALWALGAEWDEGIKHRRKARKEHRETHSLWWHVRTAAEELKQFRKARKRAVAENKPAEVHQEGTHPYLQWFEELDARAAAKLVTAEYRMAVGRVSDIEWLDEVGEYRINWGPGYRVYLALEDEKLIPLSGGGTQNRQQADLVHAKALYEEYKQQKAKPKPKPRANTKSEPKPEPKANAKSEPKPKPKANAKSEPKAKPGAKATSRAKPEPKSQQKAQAIKKTEEKLDVADA